MGLAIALLGATASAASTRLVGIDEVRFEWAVASGNPTSYLVSVSRNRGSWALFQLVRGAGVIVPVSPGETLSIVVRAVGLDANGALILGPQSAPSEEIEIAAAPLLSVDGEWTLFCPTCPAVGIRSLADGSSLDEVTAPGAPWTLAARVWLGPNQERLVWQDPESGWISLWDAIQLAPVPGGSAAAPPGAAIVGAGDFDRDGAGEIVLHDAANQRVEFWGVKSGRLQRLLSMPAPSDAKLVSCADFNGDGEHDLLWLAANGVRVWRFTNLSPGGPLRLALLADVPVLSLDWRAGYDVVGVADYDARGGLDLLLRDAVGNLTAAYFIGDLHFQSVALLAASGDAKRRVVGSLDLDGSSGAEVLLQHGETGEIQMLSPRNPSQGRTTVLRPGPAWRVVDVRH